MANKTIDRTFKKIDRMLADISSAKEMKKLGKVTVDIIVERTRGRGKGVKKQFGRESKLKIVTQKYAEQRKKKKLHPEAATGRDSNLTATGRLLNHLAVLSASKSRYRIGWRGELNRDKAQGQSDQGRKFLDLSRKDLEKLFTFYEKVLAKGAKKI